MREQALFVFWKKNSDWLPVANAEAQVNFWIGDLEQAEKYLKYVLGFEKYNLKNYSKILKIAQDDVKLSRDSLAKAKLKLEESRKLEK